MTDEDAGRDGRADHEGNDRGGLGEAAGAAAPGAGEQGGTDDSATAPARGASSPDAAEPDDPPVPPAVAALSDRPAAAAGMVVAAAGLVAAMLAWTDAPAVAPQVAGAGSTLAAVFAAVATAAFGGRRHGLLPRRAGAAAAGAASAAVALTAAVRLFGPATGGGPEPVVGVGLPLAAAAGVAGAALAFADARRYSAALLVEMTRRTSVGLGLVVAAFVLQYVVAGVALGVHAALGTPLGGGPVGPITSIVLSVVLADVVFGAVAVGFLIATGRGLAFVDLKRPDLEDGVYMAVGVVALFALLIAYRLLVVAAGLPSTGNAITDSAREGNLETLLVLIPLSFLLIGPAEELLNRNVIQKYLYDAFSRGAAIVVASGIFASAHVFSYWGDSAVAVVVSLTSVFVLSLALGVLYERTENIVVPTVVHGAFNAIQFGLLYVVLKYGDELEAASAAALPW